ncbi:MAG: putative penicillin acylase [Solirubrobacterales bacterium]|nr:putative penicillin acylase [Solirubrobacterales bacterium]
MGHRPSFLAATCALMIVVACSPGAAAAQPTSLPSVSSGHRPGPDVLYAPVPDAPQLQNVAPWHAPPILVSGASAYRDGEFLYQDFLQDDRGAGGVPDPSDPHDLRAFLFSPKSGTLTYPTDPVFANNAADLVELRVRPLVHATAFRVTVNTLKDATRTAFTIAIGSSETARAWPHAAGVRSPAELFLTVHGSSAELVRADTGAPVTPVPTATVDAVRRQFDVRVPHAAFDPGARTIRLAAGIGLWDKGAGHYLTPGQIATATTPGGAAPGGAALFNVAFRANEPAPDVTQGGAGITIADAAVGAAVDAAWWRERRQSEALRRGDAGAFSAQVDFGKLAAGTDDESAVPATGPMDRILASAGEAGGGGIDHTKVCFDLVSRVGAGAKCEGRFQNQLQQYALYVPVKPRPTAGYGFTLLLHSLSGNHNQYLASRNQAQLGERGTGSLVATPSGRGPDGFYAGLPEADTFEVWADVARHYRLDPARSAVSGYSMGGFGTYRLLARWPDLFARGFAVVGVPGTVSDQLASLRNTPLMTWNAAGDELVNILDSEQAVADLAAAGVRFTSFLFPVADHLTLATNDEYGVGAAFLGDHHVERDPPHVTYVVDTKEDSAPARAIADHAYWVSDLTARDPTATATIDARSEAFGTGDAPVPPVRQGAGTLDGGARGPMPFVSRERAWGAAPATVKADRLVLTATNLASVTVDARRARLSCAPLLAITSDGPVDVRISCPAPKRCVSRRVLRVTLPRLDKSEHYVRSSVRVGTRKAKRYGGPRRTLPVSLKGLRAKVVKVTITARTNRGRTVRQVRTYRPCTTKRG